MNIIICDDDPAFLSYAERTILQMDMPDVQVEVFTSGDSLLSYLRTGDTGQIYLLDIEMPGQNGIEAARQIRMTDTKALIVFMTHHHEYVYSVFEVMPFRFLRKPFSNAALRKAITDCLRQLYMTRKYYFFKNERMQHQLPYDEILYFECRGRKICIHTTAAEYEFYGKMSDTAAAVDTALFCRIHASYIVNMDAIRSISDKEVSLTNDERLPISRSFKRAVKEKHLNYMMWKGGVTG